jgi:RimJ/RimL family protein N-acetyltransferase
MKQPPHDLELGYRLRRASWKKGYATEGSRALLGHAFEKLGEKRVVAEAFRENVASTNVMKKVGMTFDREELEDGKPIDWYAIDAQTWASLRGARGR